MDSKYCSGVAMTLFVNLSSMFKLAMISVRSPLIWTENKVAAKPEPLVEIVHVIEVRTSNGIKDNWSIWTNQQGNGTSTTSWSGWTWLVQGDVTTDDNGVSTVPRGGFDPVDGVKHSSGPTVTSVDVVNTFNVMVITE
ncbi:hypothetical protein WICPIJ_008484 [Wickerhamomyces pijperi]|uniref:Uncharacterized protein n=1 Tax=Wickerhamomyces pijperi TaxID=599730 RepID=A0A9P8PX26_WICPI|nr:hypothetical protein WICPIJ_008484 [Wickerhamomyces pijperi]